MRIINTTWKKVALFMILSIIVSLGVVVWFKSRPALSPIIPPNNSNVTIDEKNKYSTTEASSLWVVVNKQHPLSPINYTPTDLVTVFGATISSVAKSDFTAMNSAALADSIDFSIVSSYRSYASQNNIYNNYVVSYGQASTDTFSARPGYSEHQTGLTLDLGSNTNLKCNLDTCFNTTVEGKWLTSHASEYGFVLRYPVDKQQITGYRYEPWHFRYVGQELAAELKNSSITTLEEFFNISGGETYF